MVPVGFGCAVEVLIELVNSDLRDSSEGESRAGTKRTSFVRVSTANEICSFDVLHR